MPKRSGSGEPARSSPTRERLTTEAMRLFGERGYAATSVAEIEAAAGLRPGSGGLYRHFSSKEQLLETGIRQQLASRGDLMGALADPSLTASLPLRERLTALAKWAIARLDNERDVNRIIMRDLRFFPDLLELVRVQEMKTIEVSLSDWLRLQVEPEPAGVDWDALASVLMGAVSHYWLLRDSMDGHPSGLDEDRYLASAVDLVVARLSQ